MDKGGGSQTQHISEDESHLLFISSLWELNSLSFFFFFLLSELMLSVHIFMAVSLNPHTGFLSPCLNQQYVYSDLKNPDKIKCPKTNTACACFYFLNSLSLFVFPPSSGLTPSQYAVSVLERKSQIGTSGQKSCCPVQTVGAVVSRLV